VLQRPADVVAQYQATGQRVPGDCDDYSMFVASVARAIDPDADVQFVCVAAEPAAPGVLSHIYCKVNGVPVDASHGLYPGWEVPQSAVSRRVEYSLSLALPLMTLAAAVAAWLMFGGAQRRRLAA
jgi:hypothetical protein